MAFALVCAIAAPLAVLFHMCGTVSFFAAFAAMALLTVIVLSIGRALLGASSASHAAAWVVGVLATSLALLGLQWLGLQVTSAAAMLAVVAGGLAWRQRGWRMPIGGQEFFGVALCGGVTLLWCHHSASAPATLAQLGVLPVWIDYVIHGAFISGFGDPLAWDAGSIDLAGMPRSFYHYASYLLPSVLARPFDLPGLPLATSVWLPLGFFTMCAGAYAFGQALSGPAGGIAAVAALTLIPDAGGYGLRNALFGFNWHVLTQPGATYAIGIALVALVLLRRWHEERRPRLLMASFALASALLLFRAHLFLLAAPCVLASAVTATARFRRHWLACAGAALCLLVALYAITDGTRALRPFLATVHDQPGIAYAGWYEWLLEHYGVAVAIPIGMVLVFLAFLGVFTLLYPVALWLRHRAAADAIPLLLLGGYAALMVLAPIPANGDPTEFTQRPFVLVYAVLAIWTMAVIAERIDFRWLARAALAGVVTLWPYSGFWSEAPQFSWGWNYYARALTPGLPQAAIFLRKEGKPGDRFAVARLQRGWAPIEQPGWVPTDAAVELSALSGMPAYIARPYLDILQGGERQWVAQERLALLEAVERETRTDVALARLAEHGIHWYVATGGHGPLWDPGRRRSVFSQGAVAVYRTTSR